MRALAGWCLCALVLASGMLTAAWAAENRARGDELDRLERWCEAQSRRNDLRRVANQRLEWSLLAGARPEGPEEPDEARPRGEVGP